MLVVKLQMPTHIVELPSSESGEIPARKFLPFLGQACHTEKQPECAIYECRRLRYGAER